MWCLQLVFESLPGDKPNLNNAYVCTVKASTARRVTKKGDSVRQFFVVSNERRMSMSKRSVKSTRVYKPVPFSSYPGTLKKTLQIQFL